MNDDTVCLSVFERRRFQRNRVLTRRTLCESVLLCQRCNWRERLSQLAIAGGWTANTLRTFHVPQAVAAFLIVACVNFSTALGADAVTKKSDGKRISGTISAMTRNDVTIKRPQGEETIRTNDIALIDWDGASGDLKFGYTEENNGRLDQALQRFQKAKSESKSPSTYLQGEFDYIVARVIAKQALASREKRDAAIQKLLAAQKAYPTHIRYFESLQLLIQLQLSSGDFNGARKTIEELKRAPSGDLNLISQIAEAKVLAAEGKIDESIAAFSAVANSTDDSPNQVARKYEAQLGQARGLISQSKFDESLKVLESITERKGPIDDPAVEAEALVLQGNALRGMGRTKDAILSFLSVDILFPKETDAHAEALYQLIQLWKVDQHPDRSAEAAGKLAQLYPNSEWRKKLGGTE